MNTAKTIRRFDSFMYTNKQYSSFFKLYTHQTYKEIQNKKHVNSKPKELSNIMFRTSLFLLETFWYLYKLTMKNEKRVETTVANQHS